jgi:hypothetical protein
MWLPVFNYRGLFMMKRVAILSVFVGLAFASMANAASPLQVKPFVFDPDNTGICEAAWVNNIGLPDAGKSNHALMLTKEGLTATNAASGATVTFQGTLTELGFDYRNDSHCGAGAPRFNVYTASGTTYFFGCDYGAHTPVPGNPDWTRVRFAFTDGNLGGDAFAVGGPFNVNDFNSVVAVQIIFDEGTDQGVGYAIMDNIDVNGTLVGKPGAAK